MNAAATPAFRLVPAQARRHNGLVATAGFLLGVAALVIAIGGSVASVLSMPFSQMVTVLLYLDLRARKEGITLERLQWEVGSTS